MELSNIIGEVQLPPSVERLRMTAKEPEDLRGLTQARTPDERRQALRKASQEFEAVFVRQMISAMRKTVGDGGLIKKSNGEQIFEGMLDEEWAKKLSGRGGPDSLSEILYRQLSRQMGLEEETGVQRGGETADFMQMMSGIPLAQPPGNRREEP